MKLIVITDPDFFEGEAAYINALFADGLEWLHVRKPASSVYALQEFLDQITPVYRSRLALHQHHQIADQYGIQRLHFTESARTQTSHSVYNRLIHRGFLLSTSIHGLSIASGLEEHFSYAFLAPVFDSISKPGHQGMLPADFRINTAEKRLPLIALGGVTDERITQVAEMGFAGAAVLGTIWKNPKQSVATFMRLKQAFENLTEHNRDRETSIHI